MSTKATSSNQQLLLPTHFWSESRFFRALGLSWRVGRRLVERKILVPDSFIDLRPVFLADGQAIARHQLAVTNHLQARKRADHNL